MQSMVLSRESISSVYALVIPVSPLFATSSFWPRTGIRPDSIISTTLRRACGTSCIRLRQFHARCVRTMSRTNLNHTWIYRISTKNLQKELVLDSTNNYIARRQLRWFGHVSRMPFDRLPRRMLSSWSPSPRCTGAAKMTYGRTMKKAMAIFDINPQNWYELAADREKWYAMIK